MKRRSNFRFSQQKGASCTNLLTLLQNGKLFQKKKLTVTFPIYSLKNIYDKNKTNKQKKAQKRDQNKE